jgi:hypothetical protein
VVDAKEIFRVAVLAYICPNPWILDVSFMAKPCVVETNAELRPAVLTNICPSP